MVNVLKAIVFGLGSCLAASGCVAPLEAESEPEVTQSALELDQDRPPTATAVQVNFGNQRDLWIFTCDWSHRQRFFIKIAGDTTFREQPLLASTCDGKPAVAKWDHDPDAGHRLSYTTVRVYGRHTDNHLWELYFEDSTASPVYSWADLSDFTGFGAISGSPVVADTGANGEVSVVVTDANHFLHTFDLSNFAWAVHPVKFASGATMTTLNTVTAQSSATGIPIIAGRGFDASNDGQGWLARRTGGWNSSYVNYRTLGGGGTLMSNPTVSNDRVYATFGTDHVLKFRAVTALSEAAWTTFANPGCRVLGSPAANPDRSSPFYTGIKGYASKLNGGGVLAWSDTQKSCQLVTGAQFFSTPSWVVGASSLADDGPYAFDFVARGDSSGPRLNYYDASENVVTAFSVPLQ